MPAFRPRALTHTFSTAAGESEPNSSKTAFRAFHSQLHGCLSTPTNGESLSLSLYVPGSFSPVYYCCSDAEAVVICTAEEVQSCAFCFFTKATQLLCAQVIVSAYMSHA